MRKYSNKITIILLFLLISSVYSENRVEFSPSQGTISTAQSCTLSVKSQIPADSVVFSLEYRSQSGMLRKTNIGTVRTSPFSMIFNTPDRITNQYFYGANAVAKIFRRDDTLQIVNSPRLFLLPEEISTSSYPIFPTISNNDEVVPFANDTTQNGVSISYTSDAITLSYTLENCDTTKPMTIILDPLLSRNPFPGSDAIILFIPTEGDAQLITSVEDDQHEFTISRTGTPISSLEKTVTTSGSSTSAEISIPSYLIGGSIPDSLGINVIIPNTNDSDIPFYSFVDGAEFMAYSPILFPVIVLSQPPVIPVSPYPSLWIFFLVGFLVTSIIFLTSKTRPSKLSDIDNESSVLLKEITKRITNEELTISLLARKLKRTERELNRECYSLTGKKVPQYIQWCRIEIVKERLVSSNVSEIAIARDCGFSNIATMENTFHQFMGVAPYQFREKNAIKE